MSMVSYQLNNNTTTAVVRSIVLGFLLCFSLDSVDAAELGTVGDKASMSMITIAVGLLRIIPITAFHHAHHHPIIITNRRRRYNPCQTTAAAAVVTFSSLPPEEIDCNPNLLNAELERVQKEHAKDCRLAQSQHPIPISNNSNLTLRPLPTKSFSPLPLDILNRHKNEPYRTSNLVQTTTSPLLTPTECETLIDSAELTGAIKGWKSRYALRKTQSELHLVDLPKATQDIVLNVMPTLCSTLASQFAVSADSLRVYNALLIRYDPMIGRCHQQSHSDFGLVSANICLSVGHEGGGTWIEALEPPPDGDGNGQHDAGAGFTIAPGEKSPSAILKDQQAKPSKQGDCIQNNSCQLGCVTFHASPLWHAGVHTTSSIRRYIMTVFFISTEWIDAARRIQNRAIDILVIKDAKASRAAVELLKCSLHINPVETESWSYLMTAYARLEQWEDAVEAGRTATQLDVRNNSGNFGNWAQLGENLGALADSKEETTASSCSSDSVDMLRDEAVDAYREAVRLAKIQPEAAISGKAKHSAALAGLGGALHQRAASEADTVESGLVLKEALDLDNDNEAAWAELGVLLLEAGELEACKVCAAQMLRIQRLEVEEEDKVVQRDELRVEQQEKEELGGDGDVEKDGKVDDKEVGRAPSGSRRIGRMGLPKKKKTKKNVSKGFGLT